MHGEEKLGAPALFPTPSEKPVRRPFLFFGCGWVCLSWAERRGPPAGDFSSAPCLRNMLSRPCELSIIRPSLRGSPWEGVATPRVAPDACRARQTAHTPLETLTRLKTPTTLRGVSQILACFILFISMYVKEDGQGAKRNC